MFWQKLHSGHGLHEILTLDGAAALCGIKEVGGLTIAQKLDTAGQPDMPESAISNRVYRFYFIT
jgi:CheB methylesterase